MLLQARLEGRRSSKAKRSHQLKTAHHRPRRHCLHRLMHPQYIDSELLVESKLQESERQSQACVMGYMDLGARLCPSIKFNIDLTSLGDGS